MLQSIRLTDFKNHGDTAIRLQRLTLLVGPNGAGKTGVLRGILVATRLLSSPCGDALLPHRCDAITRRGAEGFGLSLSGNSFLHIDSAPDAASPWSITLRVEKEGADECGNLSFRSESAAEWVIKIRSRNAPLRTVAFVEAILALGSGVILHLDAAKLAKPSYLGSAAAKVMPDGCGLASTIPHFMTYERDRFDVREKGLIERVPSVERIRVRRIEIMASSTGEEATPQKILADKLVLDMRSGKALPASALSEGPLILLGLLTFPTDPEPPSLLLIDDLDRSLHPTAQAELIASLRKALEQHANLQIIATSHSPYLVDELADDELSSKAMPTGPMPEHCGISENGRASSRIAHTPVGLTSAHARRDTASAFMAGDSRSTAPSLANNRGLTG